MRQAAWEILHFHVDRIEDPRARLDAARRLARILADGGENAYASDEGLRAELRAIAERSDSELFHDDLAVPNDPVYVNDFVAHAGRFGLRYLAEAELHTMSGAGISDDAKAFLSAQTPADREQYLDFVRLRRFRQSLLVRENAPRDPASHLARVMTMHVAADPSLLRAATEGKVAQLARGLDPAAGGGGPVRKVLEALVARSPAALPIAELQQQIGRCGIHATDGGNPHRRVRLRHRHAARAAAAARGGGGSASRKRARSRGWKRARAIP